MPLVITNVLLLDNVDPSAKVILEQNGIKANLCKDKLTVDQLIEKLQDYDGMVVRSATKVTANIIEKCPKLKIIGRAGVGVDNVDIKSATKNGVIVMNTPGGNTISAAEHTCTLICCLSRNVPAADASMKAGKWDRKAFMGHELYGKTLGVIGLGRIGREAATRMQSFGMTTTGFDPIVSKEEAAKSNIEWMTLDEMWPKVDYITVHTPLIPQTKGLLNDTSFGKCKKGVRVINCARGGIIDEDALLRALESGQCGGAGLDVYVEEPTTNSALVNHPKVVACPHLGASTKEGQARCGKEIAEQFVDVVKGTSFFGVLNAPALTHSSGLSSWLSALTSLGKLIRKFMGEANLKEININASGDLLTRAGNSLKAALCVGLMSEESSINLINSFEIAVSKGISVNFAHSNCEINGRSTHCSVEARNGNMSFKLSAGLSGDKAVLLAVGKQQFSLPSPLEGCMLLCSSSNISKLLEAVTNAGASVTSLSCSTIDSGLTWVAMTTTACISNSTCAELKGAVSVQL